MISRRDFAGTAAAFAAYAALPAAARQSRAHDFSFVSIEGEPLALADYAGKALLVVNTASRCGFTHQYGDLQALWQRYRGRDFVLLGVPSNDFGGQEPGSNSEIKEFCEVNFAVDFPMTEKQRVRGPEAHPLFRWIAAELGQAGVPTWNFHKFLIAPDGRALSAWPARVSPTSETIIAAVEAVLPE